MRWILVVGGVNWYVWLAILRYFNSSIHCHVTNLNRVIPFTLGLLFNTFVTKNALLAGRMFVAGVTGSKLFLAKRTKLLQCCPAPICDQWPMPLFLPSNMWSIFHYLPIFLPVSVRVLTKIVTYVAYIFFFQSETIFRDPMSFGMTADAYVVVFMCLPTRNMRYEPVTWTKCSFRRVIDTMHPLLYTFYNHICNHTYKTLCLTSWLCHS